MRNFFLLIGFFFVFKFHAADTNKDSLYIDTCRRYAKCPVFRIYSKKIFWRKWRL